MNENITFGSWLKQRRREAGVTQEELAERIGCSGTAIRKIELGERRPSGQIAQLLAEYLKIDADEREAFIDFARSAAHAHVSGRFQSRAKRRARTLAQCLSAPDQPSRRAHAPYRAERRKQASARSYLPNPKYARLTLTGAPGIGKTRLALQVASDLVERFEDGVFLVELAAVTTPTW